MLYLGLALIFIIGGLVSVKLVRGRDILNPEVATVLKHLLLSSGNVLILGPAGSGKSTLIQAFKKNGHQNTVVLSPTGLSAVNVGGQTIHSFFHFPPVVLSPDLVRSQYSYAFESIASALDTLVIDEVSMVRSDLLDAIDLSLRLHRKNDLPFGGVRVVLIGDPYQLPPVCRNEDIPMMSNLGYEGRYFFDSRLFLNKWAYKVVFLKSIYRQKDEIFKKILVDIAKGKVSSGDLNYINHRCFRAPDDLPADVTTLTTTRAAVDTINRTRLDNMPGQSFTFRATVQGEFLESDYPADLVLVLKKGALVVFTKNDPGQHWVNGTTAEVVELENDRVVVKIPTNGQRHSLQRSTWSKIKYVVNPVTGSIKEEVEASFTQFPIRLAWAMTIHKSQGMTLNAATINFGNGTFDHGQAYVALSRCRTMEGISLARKLSKRDLIVDERVVDFMAQMEERSNNPLADINC